MSSSKAMWPTFHNPLFKGGESGKFTVKHPAFEQGHGTPQHPHGTLAKTHGGLTNVDLAEYEKKLAAQHPHGESAMGGDTLPAWAKPVLVEMHGEVIHEEDDGDEGVPPEDRGPAEQPPGYPGWDDLTDEPPPPELDYSQAHITVSSEELTRAANMIVSGFNWRSTPQGMDFWRSALTALRHLAEQAREREFKRAEKHKANKAVSYAQMYGMTPTKISELEKKLMIAEPPEWATKELPMPDPPPVPHEHEGDPSDFWIVIDEAGHITEEQVEKLGKASEGEKNEE